MYFSGKRYAVIYTDPPWGCNDGRQNEPTAAGYNAEPSLHNHIVPLVGLKGLRPLIENICESDCLLFMWAPSSHLDAAVDLGKGWGFKWATVAFIWDRGDKVGADTESYTVSQCEFCLVFKRGKIPQPRGKRDIRQLFLEERKPYSTKPDDIRNKIKDMFPRQNKLEMFARQGVGKWYLEGFEMINSDRKGKKATTASSIAIDEAVVGNGEMKVRLYYKESQRP